MLFRQLFDTSSCTFTYLLADERSREAVLIDPVFEQYTRDLALIRELKLELRFTIDTHVHADHVTSAWLLKQATRSGIVYSVGAGAENVDRTVSQGDIISFGRHGLEVRATPGHTAGCMSLVSTALDRVFTGDALLIRGCGRTDFQQGNAATMFRSIREQLFSLPDECVVYPGHDYAGRTASTIGEERSFNPRIGGAADERDFIGFMENLKLPHPKKLEIAVPANQRAGRTEGETAAAADPPWGPVVLSYAGVPKIDPEWVYEHRARVHVLDVREADELTGELGHIQGIQHIPLAELGRRASEVPREKPVIAVCRSGRRSAQATQILLSGDHDQVANLDGGMLRWRELGLASVGIPA